MRSIAAVTLFLFTVLGATASHATYTWTPLDHPGASSTALYAIDGANMVGYYADGSGTHGTHYNGSTWTTLNHPSATSTELNGIDGANMVGYYTDSSGNNHGFMVTATSPVPEPAAILLALFGLALLPRRRRR